MNKIVRGKKWIEKGRLCLTYKVKELLEKYLKSKENGTWYSGVLMQKSLSRDGNENYGCRLDWNFEWRNLLRQGRLDSKKWISPNQFPFRFDPLKKEAELNDEI